MTRLEVNPPTVLPSVAFAMRSGFLPARHATSSARLRDSYPRLPPGSDTRPEIQTGTPFEVSTVLLGAWSVGSGGRSCSIYLRESFLYLRMRGEPSTFRR